MWSQRALRADMVTFGHLVGIVLYLDGRNCPWHLGLHGICEQSLGFNRLELFQQNSVNHLQDNHWILKYSFGREMLTVFCLGCYSWVIIQLGVFSCYKIPSHDSKSWILLLQIFQKYVLLYKCKFFFVILKLLFI